MPGKASTAPRDNVHNAEGAIPQGGIWADPSPGTVPEQHFTTVNAGARGVPASYEVPIDRPPNSFPRDKGTDSMGEGDEILGIVPG